MHMVSTTTCSLVVRDTVLDACAASLLLLDSYAANNNGRSGALLDVVQILTDMFTCFYYNSRHAPYQQAL
jgi:hypothetical protein